MTDELSYPVTDMNTTAKTMRTLLDDAWAQHIQQLNTSILEPATQLGNKIAEPFRVDVQNWHQRMQECYNALHDLANSLETGATTMEQQDQNIAQGFQREGK